MQRIEGKYDFRLPMAELWMKLTDLPFLTRCIPDVASVKETTEQRAALVVKPGFSFVRGELNLTLEKIDETPPVMARMRALTKGVGTTSEVEAAFCLEDVAGGTRVHWSADVKELGGLLKAVPQGLVQAAAQRVVLDVMKGIEKNLADASAKP